MHNIKSPPDSPQHNIPTRRSVRDLLGLSRVQAPSRPLTPPRPEPVTSEEPVSQHEVSPVEETPDSQRTVIQRRSTMRSDAPVSPTAHRGSVQRLQLARAIQVNNAGDNFSYMSSLSSRSSWPEMAGTAAGAAQDPPHPPTRRVASSIYSRTASGYFLPLANELTLSLAQDAATARSFLQQQMPSSPPLESSRPSTECREGGGGLPFPNTDALERPSPHGIRGWASTGPHAAASVAARRAHEEANAANAATAATARKRTFMKKVVDRILGRK
ncbi:hypothetical protein BDV97DRAFT_343984 [Delphinella strobiligena]|nr:hypothetical protein BDV97DRAFT_343984 [Delphinella strobiligena]